MFLEFYKKFLYKKMRLIAGRVKKDPLYFAFICATIFLAVFFRTYHYQDRISLVADNSQDVQIARFAANNFKLPLAGPFSSAGPFYYGAWYFWFLELLSFLPFGFLTHWYVLTSLSFLFIILVFYLGKEAGGKWVGIISALFAAISPSEIDNSLAVWNPAIVPLLSLLVMIFLVRFYKGKRIIDLFLLGFLLGLSITIHFQSILLAPAILVAIAMVKPTFGNYLKYLPWLILGLLVPFLPLIYLDSKLYWYNFRSLFIFFTIDQFNSWIPNRWITYISNYWPDAWANIIGGDKFISALEIFVVSIFSLAGIFKIKKHAIYFVIAITFLLEIILYRYYRGQRFTYYSYFAHAPILILSGWATFSLFKFKKALGVILLLLIVIFTTKVSLDSFKNNTVTFARLNAVKKDIYSQYPGKSFDIYGCFTNPNSISYPIALLMYLDKRDDIHGIKIGLCESSGELSWQPISLAFYAGKIQWYERSTEKVYFDTAEWWTKSPPNNGSDFWNYLKTHLFAKCYPHC